MSTSTKSLLQAASTHARGIANGLRPRYESDAAFAAALGVTQSAINKFRNGKAELGMRTLLGLGHLTGRSLDDICGFGAVARDLDSWEIARLYLAGGATPQGLLLARERGNGRPLTPRECAACILDAERDLTVGPDDETHVRAKTSA